MANPFRNAMAFLGLVEEEEYVEQAQPRERAPREQAPAPVYPQPAPKAAVTPIRRQVSHHKGASDLNEILTVHPRAFKDVRTITEHYRDGIPVIINISQMTDAEARRLIDFSCGLAEALYGSIERVTGKVFLLSPAHVAVSGDQADAADDVDAAFFQ